MSKKLKYVLIVLAVVYLVIGLALGLLVASLAGGFGGNAWAAFFKTLFLWPMVVFS